MSLHQPADEDFKTRRSLTAAEVDSVRDELEDELRRRRDEWKLRGSYFTGPPSEIHLFLQIEVRPPGAASAEFRIALPTRIGGGYLVPDIEFVEPVSKPTEPATPKALACVPEPLAPGSVIFVERRRGGVAFICLLNGVPHLVTCGHLFQRSAGQQSCLVGETEVARLTGSFLPELDAAYCQLTEQGIRVAQRSAGAKTWLRSFSNVTQELCSLKVTFYSSSGLTSRPIDTRIQDERVCQYNFAYPGLWSGLDLCGLMMTPPITRPGDSGSLLVCGDLFLGLCTGGGFNGIAEHSFFTPLATVIRALSTRFKVRLWDPSANSRGSL